MAKIWDSMLEHPIATWMVVGTFTNAIANIVSVARGGSAVPVVNINKVTSEDK